MHARRRLRAGFERGIPVGMVDVDWTHFDAMLAQIAHDLRRRVEPHRLRIEQCRRKHIRIAAFEPGRSINEQREARGVTFRETVFAETLDLAEAALGEVTRIIPRHHSFDHLALEHADGAGALEGRHRAAQLVGFARREAARHDGDLHRLLLEQGDAERLVEDRFELLRRIGHRLDLLPAAQIRMHHVALDRARPHDRDFDDEIVEFLRLQTRQHRHLRAAFDLKYAQRVGTLQHAINRGVLFRYRSEGEISLSGLLRFAGGTERKAIVLLGHLECLAQAREHAQPEHIDLEDAERVEIIFVPLDEGAALHRAIADRNHLVEPAAGDDEPADMLREMTREGLYLDGERAHFLHTWAVHVDAGAHEFGVAHAAAAHAPDRGG